MAPIQNLGRAFSQWAGALHRLAARSAGRGHRLPDRRSKIPRPVSGHVDQRQHQYRGDRQGLPAGRHPQLRASQERALKAISTLSIRTTGANVNVGALSGGNQQKALLARLLETKPKVVFLDEPTRGVDVGAKSEIYRIIDELAQNGIAIVVISSDLPEIIGIADRVLVMREGRIAGEVGGATGAAIEQEAIMALATGTMEPAA
ncbi:ATP-binding cassette domain-containing protein [Rhizobium sp. G21]|uniref:ATP-binding cassette domain-containing protein n=1 Tax=Rhizobium sp. G21 TaxID=2758439 RepID=UPI003917DCBF